MSNAVRNENKSVSCCSEQGDVVRCWKKSEKPVVIHRKTLSQRGRNSRDWENHTRSSTGTTSDWQGEHKIYDKRWGKRKEERESLRSAIRVFLKYEPTPNNHQQSHINRAVRPSLTRTWFNGKPRWRPLGLNSFFCIDENVSIKYMNLLLVKHNILLISFPVKKSKPFELPFVSS